METEAAQAAFMARALQLAARGITTTHPNPRVGCVIVQGGTIVGEGFHERAGLPHAERLALSQAGSRARGATAYVTLEPCCHVGRTPPCTDALIEAGITHVVAAMEDPDTRVCGQGIAQLRAAGIAVEIGLMETAARTLNRGFIHRITQGRPFVRAKVGASLDGRTALVGGESQWITSAAARLDVQRLRAESAAIMTGAGTIRRDDPALTVRPEPQRRPVRIVVDSKLSLPLTAKVFAHPAEVIVATVRADVAAAEVFRQAGVCVFGAGGASGQVNMSRLMVYLAQSSINDVLVECGPKLLGALFSEGLVDECIFYVAPCLLGHGRPIADITIPGLADRFSYRYTDVRRVGEDLRITVEPLGRASH